jgi:hypothetical protein
MKLQTTERSHEYGDIRQALDNWLKGLDQSSLAIGAAVYEAQRALDNLWEIASAQT